MRNRKICYAIKNDEGKYFAVYQNSKHFWTTLDFAYYFKELPYHNSKETAEEFRDTYYPDCKVVKVEIKEIKND